MSTKFVHSFLYIAERGETSRKSRPKKAKRHIRKKERELRAFTLYFYRGYTVRTALHASGALSASAHNSARDLPRIHERVRFKPVLVSQIHQLLRLLQRVLQLPIFLHRRRVRDPPPGSSHALVYSYLRDWLVIAYPVHN